MQLNLLFIWKIFLLLGSSMAMHNFFASHQVTQQQQQTLPPQLDTRLYRPLQPAAAAIQTPLAPMPTINPFYKFSAKLFQLLSPQLAQTNLIYSPLSLQTLLSFVYVGASNATARELRQALEIPEMPAEVARQFQALIQQMQQQSTHELQLQMANKLFFSREFQLDEKFYKNTLPYFNAEAEEIDFRAAGDVAAYQINKWAADRTNQRILDLIPPGGLDAHTKAVLVSAIYLRAKWAKEFSTLDTLRSNFRMSGDRAVPVDMMYTEDTYGFSELPALSAKVVDLPFKDSDLSMLVLLPDEVEGLAKLEAEMHKVDLNSLLKALRSENVVVRLPKFRIDFDINMTEALKRLGITRLFSDQADLGGFFNNQTVRVSKVQQKAYINVNEGGVEAAAATFGKLVPLSAPVKTNYFNADHPFMFIIRGQQVVYFMGHVINP